ncbi:hypothetical protein KIN20_034678 [Parelaphostrongylus tenuis]|uniref:Uncharacterized protein n=1 Tax=Parelaphostrongylus tenuis TaxID=148309 RepID=A0AAD5RA17_PARTN|nr:hypothetical protein KIN20_034678 [Parelaphostrongylus tenuis]
MDVNEYMKCWDPHDGCEDRRNNEFTSSEKCNVISTVTEQQKTFLKNKTGWRFDDRDSVIAIRATKLPIKSK